MTSDYVLHCFAQSGNAYKAALITDEIGVDLNQYPAAVRWLGDIQKLDRWMHPYELMPGHPLQ
ncbi:MAG: hypothetical protein BMS9Abin01_1000 [Gammaproteobacteria bacterium]|nr:MAG: hypothetical protein BMS9Abin01_1000 [Gammaproteobacteria bacterium]